MTNQEISTLIHTALDEGINFFDHADIYGGGKSEEKFSEALDMNPSLREKMILQTKCGIRKGCFDFSKEHILEAVDGSLKRLRTDYVDVLLLHRPDALVEPEEVAEAFTILQNSGKVKIFRGQQPEPDADRAAAQIRKAEDPLQPAPVQHHQHRHDRRGDQRQHGNRPPPSTGMAAFWITAA